MATETLALPGPHLPPELASASTFDLIRSGFQVGRVELVPVDLITLDGSVIDDARVANIARSLSRPRGQAQPISVRAREDSNQAGIAYDVIDGYHRHAAARLLGWPYLEGKVQYGCDNEEYNDLRILSANPEGPVLFARTATWMQDIFAISSWGNRGLSVAQAFGIAAGDSEVTRLVSLTAVDIRDLRLWCQDKCRTWQRNIRSVYSTLRVAANADPGLVAITRNMAGGKQRSVAINPTRLQIVADHFPKEAHWPTQRALLKAAVEKGLYTHQVAFLVTEAARLLRPGMTEEEIYQLARDIRAEEVVKPAIGRGRPSSEQQLEQTRLARDTALGQVRALQGEVAALKQNATAAAVSRDELTREKNRRKEAEDRIQNLQAQVDGLINLFANRKAQPKQANGEWHPWWHTDTTLTVQRRLLDSLFMDGRDLETTAKQLGLADSRAAFELLGQVLINRRAGRS